MTQPTNRRFVMEPRLDAEVATINTQLNLKAPLASPALTGTPTSTTAAVDTSTTQIATTAFVTNQAAAATSPMDGTAAVGTSKRYARQDHVHPTDTTRAPLASPALTGTPTSTTAAANTNTTQIATTAYVVGQASATAPVMDGTATVGTSLKYARADHVHPTDTSRAPAAGSSSITTVGAITSGTWQGTDVGLAYGGTNASLTAVNGGAVYSDAAGLAITAAGTSGQVLKSNGAAAPTWQTNNLDSLSDVIITTPSAGQTLAYNGTNWINGSGGGGGVTASATAPASPVNGSAWFDTNDGTLYVYYTDANGSQWVEVQADSALGSQLATRMSTAETNITALQAVSPNYLLNADFNINQRAFTSITSNGYGFDRWVMYTSSGTTYTPQTFTPGSGPAAGIEAQNYARVVTTGQTGTTAYTQFAQKIEDVRILAGKTVTVSFYAKAVSGTPKVAVELVQNFGTGGTPSANVNVYAGQVTLSTSWTRYSVTTTLPSLTGKNIGTDVNSSHIQINLWTSAGTDFNARTGSLGIQSNTFDFWGVQLEQGSMATGFRRNAPSLQAELAACQRYFYAIGGDTTAQKMGIGTSYSTTDSIILVPIPTPMRAIPAFSFSSAAHFTLDLSGVAAANLTALAAQSGGLSTTSASLQATTASVAAMGSSKSILLQANSLSSRLYFSAEL